MFNSTRQVLPGSFDCLSNTGLPCRCTPAWISNLAVGTTHYTCAFCPSSNALACLSHGPTIAYTMHAHMQPQQLRHTANRFHVDKWTTVAHRPYTPLCTWVGHDGQPWYANTELLLVCPCYLLCYMTLPVHLSMDRQDGPSCLHTGVMGCAPGLCYAFWEFQQCVPFRGSCPQHYMGHYAPACTNMCTVLSSYAPPALYITTNHHLFWACNHAIYSFLHTHHTAFFLILLPMLPLAALQVWQGRTYTCARASR